MDPAHAKAHSLAAGDFAAADPWFLNALARNPGDLSLICDFAAAVRAAAASRRPTAPQEAQRQLEWLAEFVAERVAMVDPADLEALLELAARVRAEAKAETAAAPAARPTAPRVDPVAAFADLTARLNASWPQDVHGLRDALPLPQDPFLLALLIYSPLWSSVRSP